MDTKDVSDRSRFRSQSRSRPFSKRFSQFQKSCRERSWHEKAARNAKNNRHVPIKIILNLILLFGCFTETLLQIPLVYQIVSYLILFALFVGSDPLEALTRYLAPQSRYILSLSAIILVIIIIRPYRPFMVIAGGIVSAGITGIRFFNQSWLAAYNWKMSAAVQKALLIDVDNKATQAWQAHGQRETRTLLYELGYEATDDLLDILHRPVYLCGFLNGFQKTVKYKSKLQTAEDSVKKYRDQLHICTDQLKELRQLEQSMSKDYMELKSMLRDSEEQASYWEKMYQQEHKLAQQLEQANEELLQAIDEPSEQLTQQKNIQMFRQQTMEEKVLSALASGLSLSEAGKAAGCSKSKAYRIKQQHQNAAESN